MEKDNTQSPELVEIIEIVKRLIDQADEKIRQATEKIKAAESDVSTASKVL